MQLITAINNLVLFLNLAVAAAISPPTSLLLPSDAVSILAFKSKADLNNRLLYTLNERFDYCQWQGVTCLQGRVVKFVLQGFGLRGTFTGHSLTRLDQLRVLNLRNNSLFGPLPDFSGLVNLKSLILGQNYFSGTLPASVISLHRIRAIDLSFNNFTGLVPGDVASLYRLTLFRLELNRFTGKVPALNQSSLRVFNVSGNNFSGEIPNTPILLRFGFTSFLWNPYLCGQIINKDCYSSSPFFEASVAVPPPTIQNAESQGVVVVSHPLPKNHKRTGLVLGSIIVITFFVASVILVFTLIQKHNNRHSSKPGMELEPSPFGSSTPIPSVGTVTVLAAEEQISGPKLKKCEETQRVKKDGSLVFCSNEAQSYTLEQLMRASAELLGRGTMGTTYKAVLDNQLTVTVKRLDAVKTAITSGDVYERHMETVGCLRHPNLVAMQAYFQANEERLIVYDYQPNGSLRNLIHGSRSTRSTRAKPLHWTSCLKIAEDVAQGLAYIHQASKLVHGNLKSSNVLLGPDFEACLTDYGLAILAHASSNDDPDSAAYKAPESRKSSLHATPKYDVYAFGVLLLELLTGKHPSQHPYLLPNDMPNWVRAMRDDDGEEGYKLEMLVEVASACSLRSPEQRPVMWRVLRMIQEIKECDYGGSYH